MSGGTKSIEDYEREYSADYGFEAEIVRYRQKRVLDFLKQTAPRRIVEIGCGPDLLAGHARSMGMDWDEWIAIEPADAFAAVAKSSDLPNLTVKQGFFEDVAAEIESAPDALICSGLLHEVPDVNSLMGAMVKVMGVDTTLHANVPNAESMHRRLAQQMGLIENLTELSDRNVTLQQPRVFDQTSLRDLATGAGLSVLGSGGYFVKPFTHGQMEKCADVLTREVLDGLDALGAALPELASEIWIEARLS